MRLERRLKVRDQLLKLVEGQAGQIQELRGAGLHIGKPYTGHLWCLLSWEAQYTIIGINSSVCAPSLPPARNTPASLKKELQNYGAEGMVQNQRSEEHTSELQS